MIILHKLLLDGPSLALVRKMPRVHRGRRIRRAGLAVSSVLVSFPFVEPIRASPCTINAGIGVNKSMAGAEDTRAQASDSIVRGRCSSSAALTRGMQWKVAVVRRVCVGIAIEVEVAIFVAVVVASSVRRVVAVPAWPAILLLSNKTLRTCRACTTWLTRGALPRQLCVARRA